MANRHFILKRMADKGFPDLFINWVQACIDDIHFSISINGILKASFPLQLGEDRDVLFSPFLFYIIMDVFSCLLDTGFLNDKFEAVRTSCAQTLHLLYIDNQIMFGKANEANVNTLEHMLNYFYSASGLSINLSKSSIFFFKSISNSEDLIIIINTNCTKLKFT